MKLIGTGKWGTQKSYKGQFKDDNLITLQEFFDIFIEGDDEKFDKYYKVSLVDTIEKNAVLKDQINVVLFFENEELKMQHSTGCGLVFDFEYYHRYFVRFGYLDGYMKNVVCRESDLIEDGIMNRDELVGHQYVYSQDRKKEHERIIRRMRRWQGDDKDKIY